MRFEIERINAPEDDFTLKLGDTLFFISERECKAIARGLQQGSTSEFFRIGEEVTVQTRLTNYGVEIHIESGYSTEWKDTVTLSKYYEITRSISRICGEEIECSAIQRTVH